MQADSVNMQDDRQQLDPVSLQSMATAMGAPFAADGPRLTEWEPLAAALRREGLLSSRDEPASRHSARTVTPVWLRVAAALVLTTGGAIVGRLSSGAPPFPGGDLSYRSPVSQGSLASDGTDGFGSVQQASAMLYRAQRDYERASLWLAGNDTTSHSSDVYRARLAALDQMMAASRAALRDAPNDPLLNQYFLAAYTAREATLQALGGTLPVDKSLERY